MVKNGKLKKSRYLANNYSNLLRVAILSRFGGTYLDTDIIVLRRLPDVKNVPNFVGRQDKNLISKKLSQHKHISVKHCKLKANSRSDNAAMRFQRGHKILDDLQLYLSENFDGNIWGHNGPKAVTQTILKMCKNETFENVLVYPKEQFYSIPWEEYWKFFNVDYKKEILDKTKESYGIHMWNAMNKLSKNVSYDYAKDSAFKVIALKYCPLTAINS